MDSTERKGSCFTFTLLTATTNPNPRGKEGSPKDIGSLGRGALSIDGVDTDSISRTSEDSTGLMIAHQAAGAARAKSPLMGLAEETIAEGTATATTTSISGAVTSAGTITPAVTNPTPSHASGPSGALPTAGGLSGTGEEEEEEDATSQQLKKFLEVQYNAAELSALASSRPFMNNDASSMMRSRGNLVLGGSGRLHGGSSSQLYNAGSGALQAHL